MLELPVNTMTPGFGGFARSAFSNADIWDPQKSRFPIDREKNHAQKQAMNTTTSGATTLLLLMNFPPTPKRQET